MDAGYNKRLNDLSIALACFEMKRKIGDRDNY
jgi:hypothetical protein